MNNLRIKHVITAVIGVLILLTTAVGAIGFHTTQRAVDLLENLALRAANQQTAVASIELRMEMNRSHILQALQHNPENRFAALHNHPLSVHSQFITNNSEELRREIATLRASVVRPETRQAIEQWARVSNNFGMAPVSYTHLTLPTTPYV